MESLKQTTQQVNSNHKATGDLLSLEREAREFGNPELVSIAEKIKDANARLLRGERVPPNELGDLIEFVHRNTSPEPVQGGTRG